MAKIDRGDLVVIPDMFGIHEDRTGLVVRRDITVSKEGMKKVARKFAAMCVGD